MTQAARRLSVQQRRRIAMANLHADMVTRLRAVAGRPESADLPALVGVAQRHAAQLDEVWQGLRYRSGLPDESVGILRHATEVWNGVMVVAAGLDLLAQADSPTGMSPAWSAQQQQRRADLRTVLADGQRDAIQLRMVAAHLRDYRATLPESGGIALRAAATLRRLAVTAAALLALIDPPPHDRPRSRAPQHPTRSERAGTPTHPRPVTP